MNHQYVKNVVEASLLAAGRPLSLEELVGVFDERDGSVADEVKGAIAALAEEYATRGLELLEVASGYRVQIRASVAQPVARLWQERPAKYSRALLETLALIAYRQPITRPEIEQIRGVVVSSNIIKTMEEREWIRVVGYRDVPGKPALFGTTRMFLDYFNLKSLDQLPPLSEIRDMEDPQLRFEQEPLPARIVRDLPIDPDEETAIDAEPAADGSEPHDQPHVSADAADTDGTHHITADAPVSSTSPDSDGHGSDLSPPAEIPTSTADEAANPAADVEPDTAEQDTEEYRA